MTRRTLVAGALLVAGATALTGCVERRMLIRSDPVGARLLLDLEEIAGRTPIEVPIEHAGTRGVTLMAPGHAVFEGTADVRDPWYEWFPFDFFAEVVWPGTIEDVQAFDFTLRPYPDGFAEGDEARLAQRISEVRARADAYRAGGSRGPVGDELPPPPDAAAPNGNPLPPPRSATEPPVPPGPRGGR